jgi:hypothetical protein
VPRQQLEGAQVSGAANGKKEGSLRALRLDSWGRSLRPVSIWMPGVGRSVSSSAAQLETDIVLGHVAAGCFQSFHECLSPGMGMRRSTGGVGDVSEAYRRLRGGVESVEVRAKSCNLSNQSCPS